MSHQLWFLWLILGLKIPLIGLFYFIFRVMRNQDKAWEQGEIDVGGKSLGRPQGDETTKKKELIAEIISHFSL